MLNGIVVLTVLLLAIGAAAAQDVQGVELCTQERNLDKRTSCLQSNVGYLQQLVAKNASDAQQKLNVVNGEIAALKSALATLQASLEQLHLAAKKSEGKKSEDK